MSSSVKHHRHDLVTDALRNISSRAGISSTREPIYAHLDPTSRVHCRARADLCAILNPGPGLTAVDTAVTHTLCLTSLQHGSSCNPGTAAAAAAKSKNRGFARYNVRGLTFDPFAIESFGYVDKQGMQYLNQLAHIACSSSSITKTSFLASAHREISVALCKGNSVIWANGMQNFVRCTGHAFIPGLPSPSAELEG